MAGWCNNGNLRFDRHQKNTCWRLALVETISREMKANPQIIYPSIVLKDMPPSSWTLTGPWMACFKFLHPEKQASLYDQPGASSLFLEQITSNQHTFAICWYCHWGKNPENCKLLNFLFFVTCDTNVTSSHPALPISTTTAPRAASYIADRRTSWCVSITANAIRVLRQTICLKCYPMFCYPFWNRVVTLRLEVKETDWNRTSQPKHLISVTKEKMSVVNPFANSAFAEASRDVESYCETMFGFLSFKKDLTLCNLLCFNRGHFVI